MGFEACPRLPLDDTAQLLHQLSVHGKASIAQKDSTQVPSTRVLRKKCSRKLTRINANNLDLTELNLAPDPDFIGINVH
jgi:hypothetical protein